MSDAELAITLVFTNEQGRTDTIKLKPGRYVIGRAPDCDVSVPDSFTTVSRHHALLIIGEGGDVTVEDIESRAGVAVNGRIVQRETVEHGDVIVLGDLSLQVRFPQPVPHEKPAQMLFLEPDAVANLAGDLQELADRTAAVIAEVGKRIVGQQEIIRCVWAALLARGHCLLVGVPGLAKTLLVNTLADVLGLKFSRIQFTPDLMPSDILGSQIISRNPAGEMEFRFEQGPIFTQLLLADEINRTPPKTQAALLQAMQEREVTVSRNTFKLGPPFCVIATQNPIEQEGTYPLPEAQQDRFLFCLLLSYPDRADEKQIVVRHAEAKPEPVHAVLTYDQVLRFQDTVERVAVTEELAEVVTDLVRATRPQDGTMPADVAEMVDWGAGPRAGLCLVRAAKAFAAMQGRPVAALADVERAVKPVLRHRLGCNYRAQASGRSPDSIVEAIMEQAFPSKGRSVSQAPRRKS